MADDCIKPLEDNWHCPHCGSTNVYAFVGLSEDNGTQVSQLTECPDCKKEWREIYKLVGYIEPRKEEDDGDQAG
jgi:DNA-directed RNA polymerase subunit M/transcription elongation factor TFIIS